MILNAIVFIIIVFFISTEWLESLFLVDESHELIDSFVFVLYRVDDDFHFLLEGIELSFSFLGLLVLLVDDSV